MINTIFDALFHPFAFLLYGLMTHFGRKIVAALTHDAKNLPKLSDYWKSWHNRIKTMMSLIGGLVGYGLYAHFPDYAQMAPDIQKIVCSTAFGIGYLSDNIADAIGDKAINRIREGK